MYSEVSTPRDRSDVADAESCYRRKNITSSVDAMHHVKVTRAEQGTDSVNGSSVDKD
jgi:hypothetical protein